MGYLVREDMSCKCRIVLAKEDINLEGRAYIFLDITLRKRLVKSFLRSVLVYGIETCKLRKEEERRLQAFEVWRRED